MRVVYIAFQECEVRGDWTGTTDVGKVAWIYTSEDEDGQVHLVRQDGLKRAFSFKKGSVVGMIPMTVFFESDNVTDELTVDEDERAGGEPKPKLKFT